MSNTGKLILILSLVLSTAGLADFYDCDISPPEVYLGKTYYLRDSAGVVNLFLRQDNPSNLNEEYLGILTYLDGTTSISTYSRYGRYFEFSCSAFDLVEEVPGG